MALTLEPQVGEGLWDKTWMWGAWTFQHCQVCEKKKWIASRSRSTFSSSGAQALSDWEYGNAKVDIEASTILGLRAAFRQEAWRRLQVSWEPWPSAWLHTQHDIGMIEQREPTGPASLVQCSWLPAGFTLPSEMPVCPAAGMGSAGRARHQRDEEAPMRGVFMMGQVAGTTDAKDGHQDMTWEGRVALVTSQWLPVKGAGQKSHTIAETSRPQRIPTAGTQYLIQLLGRRRYVEQHPGRLRTYPERPSHPKYMIYASPDRKPNLEYSDCWTKRRLFKPQRQKLHSKLISKFLWYLVKVEAYRKLITSSYVWV